MTMGFGDGPPMTGMIGAGTDELTVTSTGMAHTSSNPMSMHSSIEPLGLTMNMDGATSDLFKSTDCHGATCRFTTKKKCEGSIEKLATGDVRIVAAGACQDWSGTWSVKR
jgi:hypothetical protein